MTAITKTQNQVAVNQESLVADWIDYCDVSASTAKSYVKAACHFLNYLSENEIVQPTRSDIKNYRNFLKDSVAITTARLYLSITRIFVKWLATKGIVGRDIFDNIKTIKFDMDEKHLRDAISLDECRRAIDACGYDTEKNLRDKACIAIMANCGLRTIEITRLNREDFFRKGGNYFLNVLGKGKVTKVAVPLPSIIAAMIQNYLNLRGKRGNVKKNSPLFVSTSNRNLDSRLQTQTISRLAKSILRKIGVDNPKKTAHSFRAAAATIAITAGVDIRKISKLLRHKSLLTTERYLKDNDFNNTADIIAAKIFS